MTCQMDSGQEPQIEGAPLGTPSCPPTLTLLKSDGSYLETRSFLLTVSVPGDISDACVKCIVKHIRARTVHAYCVTESGESDRRHLHAVLVYKAPMVARKIRENVWERLVKPHHSDAKGSIAVKVQVCPGHDWYDTYLKKETDCTVHLDTYNREQVTDYFPTLAVQEALIQKATTSKQAAPYLTLDTELWAKSDFPNTSYGALSYLKHRMFVLRNMIPIADKRKLCDKAHMYYEYRNGVTEMTPDERRRIDAHHAVFEFKPT